VQPAPRRLTERPGPCPRAKTPSPTQLIPVPCRPSLPICLKLSSACVLDKVNPKHLSVFAPRRPPSIASPCRTTLHTRSTRSHTRQRRTTFHTQPWLIPTCSRDSSPSPPILHRTRIPRPRCSLLTPTRRPKASRAMRAAIAARPRAQTCRCRPSICRQFVCRMASNRRRNRSPSSSPWAHPSLRRNSNNSSSSSSSSSNSNSIKCLSTILTQRMRSLARP